MKYKLIYLWPHIVIRRSVASGWFTSIYKVALGFHIFFVSFTPKVNGKSRKMIKQQF